MFIPTWLLITVGIILAVVAVVAGLIIYGLWQITAAAGEAADGFMKALWNR